jgi:hypothetical protein
MFPHVHHEDGREAGNVAVFVQRRASRPPLAPGAPAMTNGPTSERIRGTIVGVNGHLVTLEEATHDLVIDDQPALDRQATGRVAVGRSITAHGHWQDGTFFADRFDPA